MVSVELDRASIHYSTLHTSLRWIPSKECENKLKFGLSGCMFSTTYCLGTWGGGDLLAFIFSNPLVEVITTLPSIAVF
jgi:hypothetical protein